MNCFEQAKEPRITCLFDGAPPRYKSSDLLDAMGDLGSAVRHD